MDTKLTSQEAINMRNSLESALLARIEETLSILDEYVGCVLDKPEDHTFIAEKDRLDNFFSADREKFNPDSDVERYERFKSEWVWATRTCQPFPGRNRFVRKLDDGLELWFRIEFAFRGFAGFTVYNPKKHDLICFRDIPCTVAEKLYADFDTSADKVADNCWWVISEYLPNGPEESSPNFRMMDDLSLKLLDDENFDKFIQDSKRLIDKLLKYCD